jgi:hypothetical protein
MATASTTTEDVLSDQELADRGMKKTAAWVRDKHFSKAKKSAADRKKAERERRKKEKNETQVNVFTIDNEKAIATLRAVAQAIKDPDALAVISAVVVDDAWLRWLINAVSIARFREIEGILPEDAEKLWRSVRSAIEIAINHDSIIKLLHELAAGIDRIDLARLVVKADARLLAAIAAVAVNDPGLAQLIVEIVNNKNRNRLFEQAVIMATREPKLVVGLKTALQAGGFRAWVLKRMLGA